MSIFEAIVFGLIQGLTEFLPVSISGHLALFKHLFGVDFEKFGMSFDVALHLATIVAVIVVLLVMVSCGIRWGGPPFA